MAVATLETDLGPILLEATARGLARVTLSAGREPAAPLAPDDDGARAHAHLERAVAAIRRHLARGRERFDDLPLDLDRGLSPFTRAVLRCMRAIGPGAVRTYGQLAADVGRPGAGRAVGRACGANPIPIVIPCHRVVASGGLGGFGCGLEWKKWLLRLEGRRIP